MITIKKPKSIVEVYRENMIELLSQNGDYEDIDRDELKEAVLQETLKEFPIEKRKVEAQREFLSYIRNVDKGESEVEHTQDAKDGYKLFIEFSAVADELIPKEYSVRGKKKKLSPFDTYKLYVDTSDVIQPDSLVSILMGTRSPSTISKYRQMLKDMGYEFEPMKVEENKTQHQYWHVTKRPKPPKKEILDDIVDIGNELSEEALEQIKAIMKQEAERNRERNRI